MPLRPNTPCRHPGCAALVPYGTKYCDAHKPMHPEEVRSAESRGYGRAWQKARKEYLEAHPLCVECMKEEELGPLVAAWRAANPNIVQMWWAVDRAVKTAVKEKTITCTHGLTFEY